MTAEDKASAIPGVVNAIPPLVAYPIEQTAVHQIEMTKAAHHQVLDGSREIFDRWCDRRRQTAEALATLGTEALRAKSPREFLQVWVHWTTGAMDRLLDDAKDQLAVGTSVAQKVVTGATSVALISPGSGPTAGMPANRTKKSESKSVSEARH